MHERLPRNSGLKFLVNFLSDVDFLKEHGSFWVMPSEDESVLNKVWLKNRGDRTPFLVPIFK